MSALSIVEYCVFGVVCCLSLIFTILFHLSWFDFVVAVTACGYMMFLSKRNFINFIVGFVSVLLYVVVSYQSKLYGEVIFYLAFDCPMSIISFVIWNKNKDTKLTVQSKSLKWKDLLWITAVCAAGVVGYAFLLKAIGGRLVIIDSISTVVSVVATLLMCLRYREQWIMWVVVYVVSIIMWALAGNLLMILMSSYCLVSCFFGFINWTLSSKKQVQDTSPTKKETVPIE